MSLKIISINGQGDASSEYVMLRALANCDLKNYAVADSTFDASGNPSNKTRHTYFFPQKAVKEGEWVFLYTRKGTNRTQISDQSGPMHFFYWGLSNAVWNDTGDTAHLLEYVVIDKMNVPQKK